MKYLKIIIKKIMSKELPKKLGRWNIEQCNKKMNYKIDLSNEDHCGPCGQYAMTKLELKNNDKTIMRIKEKELIKKE